MAEDKKSFILYADYITTIEELTDPEAGKLLKHIFKYVNDLDPEPPEDRIVKLTFEPIKQQLKRDLRDWREKKAKRSEAGKAGGVKSGESRKQNEAKATIASNGEAKPTIANDFEANEAVNVSVSVNGTVNVKEASSSIDVFEIMRRQLLPTQFSDAYIRNEAERFVRKYKGENINSMGKLIGTWVSNMKPDIQQKRISDFV